MLVHHIMLTPMCPCQNDLFRSWFCKPFGSDRCRHICTSTVLICIVAILSRASSMPQRQVLSSEWPARSRTFAVRERRICEMAPQWIAVGTPHPAAQAATSSSSQPPHRTFAWRSHSTNFAWGFIQCCSVLASEEEAGATRPFPGSTRPTLANKS